ncbi:hypothetical protein Pcinc_039113 [Petrolisthes cinctipes]|uniref:Carboxylic ester hydrolase n=1 Tax=Petrolisthes cinctipes TaxID=88211 RepID=A0AAE1BRY6_PETCI|nr:hypothetical protein Pcinc_039113 [Petrolisthes cinctipes]
MIMTQEGIVSGVVEETINGNRFYSYHGVPYAKPPLGSLRFKPPEPAERWEGVRDSSTMPQPCLQITYSPFILNTRAQDHDYIGLEDCLYVNVFTPKIGGESVPVMVWIHGGGWFTGAAQDYNPHVLLDHGVVLVVIQYRLGILGFLSTEDTVLPGNMGLMDQTQALRFLSTEDTVLPGNMGLMDQTQALRWVQDNIHNFGGDKSRVTIFGESAGGASVHYQTLIPSAKGLFSRAITMSGSSMTPWALSHTHATTTHKIARSLHCPTDLGSEKLLSCLQSVNIRTLIHQTHDLYDWFLMPLRVNPRVDGTFLPDLPWRLIKEGRVNPVDLMSGITKDEGAFFSLAVYGSEGLLNTLNDNFTMAGPVSLCLTEGLTDDDPVKVATDIYRYHLGDQNVSRQNYNEFNKIMDYQMFQLAHDMTYIQHSITNADQDGGKKTYAYEFDHRGQLSMGDMYYSDVGNHWVCHGDELYYLFRGGPLLRPPHLPKSTPQDLVLKQEKSLRQTMAKLWTNFAATGNPTPDKSVLGFTWDAVTPTHLQHLVITPTPTMRDDIRQEVRKFYSSLPIKGYQALMNHETHQHTNKQEL